MRISIKIPTIIVLALLGHTVTAQNLRGSYQPKADGLVKKQQLEFSNAKALGQGVVWDFSQMELPNEGYNVKYTLAKHDSPDSIFWRHVATYQQGAYPQIDGTTALSACYVTSSASTVAGYTIVSMFSISRSTVK